MRDSKEVMDQFMKTWKNMMKYQEIKLDVLQPNYEDFERAYSLEKKIVATQESKEEQNSKAKLLVKKENIDYHP